MCALPICQPLEKQRAIIFLLFGILAAAVLGRGNQFLKNLRGIIRGTKWLNDHGVELLRLYPRDFVDGAGMTVEQYLQALTVHIDCCHTLLKKFEDLARSHDVLQ